jgi:hypothetical protein
MLERYPGGMQSLDTGMTGTPNRKEEHSDIVTIASSPVPKRNSSIAKSAVKEALKLSAEFERVFRVQILKDAADVYLQLRDQDAALKTIAEGSVFA